MKVKVLKSGIFVEVGQILEVSPGAASKMVKDKRAELVPTAGGRREERMVPQRQPERMKRR